MDPDPGATLEVLWEYDAGSGFNPMSRVGAGPNPESGIALGPFNFQRDCFSDLPGNFPEVTIGVTVDDGTDSNTCEVIVDVIHN